MTRVYYSLFLSLLALDVHALSPRQYYVVADDYIAPHLTQVHEKALVEFKQQADKVNYQGSWLFYEFDNGRHVAFSAKESHDYESSDGAQWQQVEKKFPKGFLSTNNEVYKQTITNQDFFLVRYLKDLSFDFDISKENPSSHLIWMELQLHRKPVRQTIVNWIKQLSKQESALRFSVYSKQYGRNLPTMYMVFHCDSIVEFYKMLQQKGKIDPLRLLPEEVYQGVEKYDISIARYIPEVSY